MAILMGGGPAVVYRTEALEALEQFETIDLSEPAQSCKRRNIFKLGQMPNYFEGIWHTVLSVDCRLDATYLA